MQYSARVDWIITNPPWSKFKDFLNHGMTVADNIVYLVTVNHYMTNYRLRSIKEAGFGIKEIACIEGGDPPGWPHTGFQLGAVLVKRNYIKNRIKMSSITYSK